MSEFFQPILHVLFVELQQSLVAFMPTIVAGLLGFCVFHWNAWLKGHKELQNLTISDAQQKMLEDAAIVVVRSINEQSRAIKKLGVDELAEKQADDPRKAKAIAQLREIFPDASPAMLEVVVDASVSQLRPEKDKHRGTDAKPTPTKDAEEKAPKKKGGH